MPPVIYPGLEQWESFRRRLTSGSGTFASWNADKIKHHFYQTILAGNIDQRLIRI